MINWSEIQDSALTEQERKDFAKEACYRLWQLRTNAGIDGKELASFWGCSPSKISRIEHASTSIDLETLLVYRDVLGLSFDELLNIDNTIPDEQMKMISQMSPTFRDTAIATINALWDTYKAKKKEKKSRRVAHTEHSQDQSSEPNFSSGSSKKETSTTPEKRNPEFKNPRFIIIDTDNISGAQRRKPVRDAYSVYTNEQKKIFAKRIKFLRRQKRLTQLALAEALTNSEYNTEKIRITCPNVASWERMHVPKPASLSLLARYFGVTEAFLVGYEQPEDLKSSYSNSNEALKVIQNVKELSLRNGEPVYVRRNDKYSFGRWMLVDALHSRLISVGIADVDFGDLDPNRYTFFTRDPFRAEMISNIEVAKKQDLVFIMTYGSFDDIKELYTGWYYYDDENAMFVKKGSKTIGLDPKEYGVSYIAFPGVPDILNTYL